MSLTLFAHPFSSYCQKVLIALYENATPFTLRVLSPDDPAAGAEFVERWPLKKMPLLIDGGREIAESTVIIEHLHIHYPGEVRLIPQTAAVALDVRFLDRVFDNYVMTPMQKIVTDALRPEGERDTRGVTDARALLETGYDWLDDRLRDTEWVAGAFSLADCAAAPALFYADWAHRIDGRGHLRAYRERLLARPSVARAVNEARPYRHLFPLGDPGRD